MKTILIATEDFNSQIMGGLAVLLALDDKADAVKIVEEEKQRGINITNIRDFNDIIPIINDKISEINLKTLHYQPHTQSNRGVIPNNYKAKHQHRHKYRHQSR